MRYKIFVITSLCISTLGCVVRSDLLSQQQATDNAQALISQIDSEQLPDKYLSLYEIIAIGLTNNLQQRIRTLELGLTNPSIELSKIELLPKAAISSGFRARNEFDGIIATPGGALVDSDLYPEKNKYADLALSWNVLDFGVSYYKTKQALNNRKIIKEIQRKSIQQLSLDLESSFWHAAMHQHFDHTIEAEISAANEVLDVKKNSHKNASTSELEALIEMQHLATQLLTINNTLDQAKSQLNHLLGLPPDSSLRLASDFSQNVLSPKQIQTEHRLLLHKALVNHPEIKKSFYQGKNAEYEINKALLRFFPGLEFNLGYQYQDISNLSNQSWAEWGNKITWNLINVLKTPTHLRLHKSAKELNDLQTQALALAIGTQLYLAEQQYICAEHLTAIIADYFMTKSPEELDKIHEGVRAIWAWHIIEETEHKAVAFDVYKQTVNDDTLRRTQMVLLTVLFLLETGVSTVQLLRESGRIGDMKMWFKATKYFLGPKGMMVRLLPDYLTFYKKDFHPWDHDNRTYLKGMIDQYITS